ncbi:methyl-accepting chemotaxis protein [Desertibacillus haloalkaliphilus]|uniref:methyl-accepting chemotaxis protein n=1 Tax=Desertibacillus haloalkaliphilus TaxID=1328930 RepID=UPI001C264F39|nr:methyl-accepting chemotaxis protein [Desertibacillus haloalkaliphilus]MBU8906488.1 methyl-accepting chemotaxis protein [Desertibacillus haloalkaliphilus]
MFRSIKTKLMAFVLLITITPLVILGLFSYFYSNQLFSDFFSSAIHEELDQVENTIDTMFTSVEEDLQYLASKPVVEHADDSIISFFDRQGEWIQPMHYASEGIEGEIYELFDQYGQAHPDTTYVYMGTVDGGYVQWPNESVAGGYDPRERPWYQQAIDNPGAPIRSEPYSYDSPDGQIAIVSTTMTVENEEGEVIGVIGIDRGLEKLSEIIGDIKVGENGYIFMMTADDTVIAHPEESYNFYTIPELNDGAHMVTGEEPSFSISNYTDILTSENQLIESEVNQQSSYVQLYTSDSTGWKMTAVLEREELLGYTDALKWVIIFVGVGALIFAAIFSFFVTSTIVNPIVYLKKQVQKVANGDLTIQVENKAKHEVGELTDDFNKMVTSMRGLVASVDHSIVEVRKSAEEVTGMSEETVASSQEVASVISGIASGASDQALQVDQTRLETVELSKQIEEVIRDTTEMSNVSSEIKAVNQRGLSQVALLNEKTSEATKVFSNVETAVLALSAKISDIEVVIDTINDISEQTNLLALNASIEAARAGDAGRGFAVVAAEIRKLSEQTTEATNQVRETIQMIQSESDKTSTEMYRTKDIASEQNQAVTDTEAAFNSIAETINEIIKSVDKVATKTSAMAENKDAVGKAIDTIAEIAEETAASTEQVSVSSSEQVKAIESVSQSTEALTLSSNRLEQQVKEFKIDKSKT